MSETYDFNKLSLDVPVIVDPQKLSKEQLISLVLHLVQMINDNINDNQKNNSIILAQHAHVHDQIIAIRHIMLEWLEGDARHNNIVVINKVKSILFGH